MTTHEKRFKLLDDIQHVRLRPGMYVGSIVPTTAQTWVVNGDRICKESITYNPGLLKVFSEILDNSIDEHKRNPTKVSKINVTIDKETGIISIYDNGGIPVVIHKETKQYIPTMIFSNLKAGSNFNDEDDQALVGTNGVGSTIVAILSNAFKIETCDGIKLFSQNITNGMRNIENPIIKKSSVNFTRITFCPDYQYFSENGLSDDNYKVMIKRVYDCAGCNPGIKFEINDKKISLKSFREYIKMYCENFEYDENEDWCVGVVQSTDGFSHISFVNSVNTYDGGTHIDYVINPITNKLREFLTKKYKIDVKLSDIKQHLTLIIKCNINRPRFNSQTKSFMISEVRDYKTSWKPSEVFMKRLLKSPIIKSIVEWAEHKQELQEYAALKDKEKERKKTSLNTITKYEPATSKNRSNCSLFIAEGDCIEENTSIIVASEENILGNKKIVDIKIGDLVLTHNNRLKPVIFITRKVSEGIKISFRDYTLIVSPEHRLLAYNKNLRTFADIAAKNLDKSIHQLVKNRIIDSSHLSEIISVLPIIDGKFDLEVTFADEISTPTYTSLSHKFLIWDEVLLEFALKEAKDLEAGIHYMVMHQE